jgi:xanthine dehydrogenase molybdenum-binding subunit
MNKTSGYKYVGKPVLRIDVREKVTGQTKYSTDLYFEDMLWAKVLRSRYPHAKIIKLDVKKARSLPGVEAILTHEDVPGHNGFGIIEPNWPVLCSDRVRYRGDAIALVAAVDEETAEAALALIEVEYEPLEIYDTPEEALRPDAVQLHEKGNIMHTMELSKGDVEKGFEGSDIIHQKTYNTQFMEHAYIETEGGVAVYNEEDGVITIWCGSQYVFRDQLQVARSLDWDPDKLRIIGSPTGGAFGGKDEISTQIHTALLAVYTKKPVRLHWTREESIVVGPKRHAFKTGFKIGMDHAGHLQAIETHLEANAGPYDTISGPVLNVAVEVGSGPYRYSNSHIKGVSVYTNNTVGGEFRGFGTPQTAFGMEQEIDKLAEAFGMDPIEFRLHNALEKGDISVIDHELKTSTGTKETLRAARETELWRNREEIKRDLGERFPDRKFGVGVASIMIPVGMGVGIPDYANVVIEVGESGNITLRTGAIEIGQGNLTAYAQMLAEALECDIEEIEVIHGDTFLTPDSGSVTASRSIMMVGNAILDGVKKLIARLIPLGADLLEVSEEEVEYGGGRIFLKEDTGRAVTLAQLAAAASGLNNPLKFTGSSKMPESEKDFGEGLPHICYTYNSQLALVGVDTGTGEIEVRDTISLPQLGRAINPAGVEGQCEGATVMGQGYALYEDVIVKEGEFQNTGFSTYIIPTSLDAADHKTVVVDLPEPEGPFGAKGIGEASTCTIAPAIANAIYDAVGVRFDSLPITPEKVWKEIRMGSGE